jgi:hypothetical protein
MVGALKALGVVLEERWEKGEMVVHGCGGRFPVEVRSCVCSLDSQVLTYTHTHTHTLSLCIVQRNCTHCQ